MENLNMWSGEFGNAYTKRNVTNVRTDDYIQKYGTTRGYMNNLTLAKIPKSVRVLEIGCNAGQQLMRLKEMGFKEERLYGIEPNESAVKLCKQHLPKANITHGVGTNIPFKDDFFPLVFTSGVLMHIPKKDLTIVMKEICRCSNRWIWGFEYWAPIRVEVEYRKNEGMLWRDDWVTMYNELDHRFHIISEDFYPYRKSTEELSTMFLLERE